MKTENDVQTKSAEKRKKKDGILKTGDIIIYFGTRYYRTPYEITGPVCSGGKAIIDRIHPDDKCRHPYHIVPTEGSKCDACGWVSDNSMKKAKSK